MKGRCEKRCEVGMVSSYLKCCGLTTVTLKPQPREAGDKNKFPDLSRELAR
jgi:hypothetical protein